MQGSEKGPSKRRALVVESDLKVRGAMAERLGRWKGWEVLAEEGGRSALEAFPKFRPDLVIVDGELCDADGREVLKSILSSSDPLALLLSSKGEEADMVIGLGIGADAYLAKPASARQVEAVCKALVRRMEKTLAGRAPWPLLAGGIAISPQKREAKIGGRELNLTKTEFDILLALTEAGGQALGRKEMAERIGKESGMASERFIDTHIKSLRKKLGPSAIRTVRGIGYALETERGKEDGR
ncbi:MAG: response regulator transcription factor [Aeriscardovia sp.]|nr:response regulator transcription factor [Aeriscardovia sp.]